MKNMKRKLLFRMIPSNSKINSMMILMFPNLEWEPVQKSMNSILEILILLLLMLMKERSLLLHLKKHHLYKISLLELLTLSLMVKITLEIRMVGVMMT